MSTDRELRAHQKRMLFSLLEAAKSKEKAEYLIKLLISEMDAEDVAFVQKQAEDSN